MTAHAAAHAPTVDIRCACCGADAGAYVPGLVRGAFLRLVLRGWRVWGGFTACDACARTVVVENVSAEVLAEWKEILP